MAGPGSVADFGQAGTDVARIAPRIRAHELITDDQLTELMNPTFSDGDTAASQSCFTNAKFVEQVKVCDLLSKRLIVLQQTMPRDPNAPPRDLGVETAKAIAAVRRYFDPNARAVPGQVYAPAKK